MHLLSLLLLQTSDVLFNTLEKLLGDSIHAAVAKAVFLRLYQGSQLAADYTSQLMKLAVETESLQLLEAADFHHMRSFFVLVQAKADNIIVHIKVTFCFPKEVCSFLSDGTSDFKVQLQSRRIIVFTSLRSWLILFINLCDFCS